MIRGRQAGKDKKGNLMNLAMPFFVGRTKENIETTISINQSKANQRNSSKMGMFCLNYGANYLSPLLECSWGDLA